MKIFAMSDIHGCLYEFEEALSLVDLSGNNMLMLLGDYTFTEKYPAETGHFYIDIIAGHIGTAEVSGNPRYHDIYFDGESHYYIDGTVLRSGVIPVIMVDTEKSKYYRVTESGAWLVLPYDEEN